MKTISSFKIKTVIALVKKHQKVLALFALTIISIFLLHNRLQNNITRSAVDDFHTINLGISSIYSSEVKILRVGESTRWLARLTYPLAMYYMNSNMGGEHTITGWNYPGGFYVRKHLTGTEVVRSDPNLQDLVFAMKFQLGILVIFSFFIAAIVLNSSYGFIAGLSYFILSMCSSILNKTFLAFYTESTMIIMFNLIIIIAFRKKLSIKRLYVWLAFILAFSVSNKLSGALYLIPVISILFQKDSKLFSGFRVEVFALLSISIFYLVNWYGWVIPDSLLDQTMSNVYHYKTGHINTEPSGMYQLSNILDALSPWIYLLPLGIYPLLIRPIKKNLVYIAIFITTILSLGALTGVNIFVERNLASPQIMSFFIISVSFSFLLKTKLLQEKIRFAYKTHLISALLILGFGIFTLASFKKINEDFLVKYAQTFKHIGLIDISKKHFPNATTLANMPGKFVLREKLSEYREEFTQYDAIIVKRSGENKHFSNYILPFAFKLVDRKGNYFVFKKKEIKPFSVERKDAKIAISLKNCSDDNIKDTFLVHVYPAKLEQLAFDRREYGFDNFDFKFPQSLLKNEDCNYTLELPAYQIKRIKVGQYNDLGRTWVKSLDFD